MEITYDFGERAALVTGAGRGVGREIVRQFAAAGARVLAADRDPSGLDETCRGLGPSVLAAIGDIRDEQDCGRLVAEATERLGRLDILVNNAAVAPHSSLLDERVEVWDTVYAVNCRGTFLMTSVTFRRSRAREVYLKWARG